MKEKIAKLIDVKSIVTLLLTALFCALALMGTISGQEVLMIFGTVIAFYFGTQHQKKTQDDGNTEPTGTVAENSVNIEELETVHAEATQEELKPPDDTQMTALGFDR